MTLRLVKIAKELNVGTSTIVDYLNSHGFEIEDKPSAKVTDEMHNILIKEFYKDRDIKEQADQLIIGNRPLTKKDTPPQPVVSKIEKPAPKEEVVKQTDATPSLEVKKEEVIEERPRLLKSTLKILGKIDLDNKKGKPEPKPVEEPKVEQKPQEKAEAEPEVEKQAPIEANKPVTEAPPTVEQEQKEKQQNEKISEKPVAPKVEAKKEDKPAVQDLPIEKESNGEEKSTEQEYFRAEAPELRGLKILGKIDTDKFKKPQKKKEKDNRDNRGDNRNRDNRGDNKDRDKSKTEGTADGKDKNKSAVQGDDRNRNRQGGTPQNNDNSDDARKKRKRKRKKITTGSEGGGGERRGGDNRDNRGGGDRRGGGNDRNRDGRGAPQRDDSKEVSQKQVEEQIKATMARLSGGGKKKRQKMRRDNRERLRERQEQLEQEGQTGKLEVTEFVSVSELASLMDVAVTDVITACLNLGVIVSINQRLDAEIIELIAEEFGHEVEFISVEEQDEEEEEIIDDPEDLEPRAPIVTVMGHVDHGKTSLLDYIREANVVSGEAGGITQHIGAYEVEKNGKKITFLDTPGHEAFTAMRARGAKITDIAIIVIAADDSIMPQTREAISHAQAANVPMIFAINKIDKAGAQPEKIKQELASMNLLVEEWGGKYQSQDISAKTGLNIDLLLEKILLEAEILELQANPHRMSMGTVLEASLDKGRGYVAKVLVQNGSLDIGDVVVAGEYSGKVKAMFNERGKRVQSVGPSAPVLVLGLSGAPQAGERFKEVESDQEARQIASKRAQIAREQMNRATKRISLDEIGRRLALGNFKELNLIVKGDVDGSVEALSDSLIKLSIEKVQVNVIHRAVGAITESDVLLASASDAIIVGFQVRPSSNARKLAEKEGVQIKLYSIIYEAIEEIKMAIEGMLEPTKEEKIVSQVEVREVFKISKVGTIAGCYVQEGKITRNTSVRIIRDGIVVFPTREGAAAKIASLKRFKEDVKEVKNGMECGISIENYNDIKVGDIIEGFEIIEIKQKLA